MGLWFLLRAMPLFLKHLFWYLSLVLFSMWFVTQGATIFRILDNCLSGCQSNYCFLMFYIPPLRDVLGITLRATSVSHQGSQSSMQINQLPCCLPLSRIWWNSKAWWIVVLCNLLCFATCRARICLLPQYALSFDQIGILYYLLQLFFFTFTLVQDLLSTLGI